VFNKFEKSLPWKKSNQVKIVTINKSGAFSKPENTLGKYYTCTKAVVDVRNLSKFPASTTVAVTFTSAAIVATVESPMFGVGN
jgi:hypothetical protein